MFGSSVVWGFQVEHSLAPYTLHKVLSQHDLEYARTTEITRRLLHNLLLLTKYYCKAFWPGVCYLV